MADEPPTEFESAVVAALCRRSPNFRPTIHPCLLVFIRGQDFEFNNFFASAPGVRLFPERTVKRILSR